MKPGIMAALGAAALFGAGTPFAKLLLGQTNPWMLAALLYLGSGAGLWLMRLARRSPRAQLTRQELAWLAGAVVAGGMVGPVLLMTGLAHMPASGAALLLNMEGVLTALIAWLVFRENVDRRIALGMACIVAGSVALSWPAEGLSGLTPAVLWPAVAVLAACLAWAVDNNLTRKVSLNDASWIAMVKGLAAGGTNLALALALGPATEFPAWHVVLAAGALGFASYGASLALHLTEQHTHTHQHEPLEHSHLHSHGPDEIHHQHAHGPEQPITGPHVHWHRHDPVTHSHSHYPDAHHQHRHP